MNSTEKSALEKRKKQIRSKIEPILKNKEKIFLYGFFSIIILYKLFYFFKTLDQAVWWDEGDYLSIAKELFSGNERPEWWAHFTGMRPLLMPIIWSFTFAVKLGEPTIKFLTLLVPSISSIFLMYKIGKDLYNQKTGIISSLMLSVYWVHHFYTYRFLTDIPAMFFGLLSIYFFWSKYIKEKKNYGLYLSIIFGIMAFAIRFPLALVLVSILLYLLITRGFSIFKDKIIWKGAGVGLLTFSPYLIYFIINKFAAFRFYFGDTAVSIKTPIAESFKTILSIIPSLMEPIWFICLIIGLLTLYKLFIGFDLIIKKKEKSLNSDLFVFLLGIINLIFYIFILRAANDRWLLMLMPPLFLLTSKGILTISNYAKKYNRYLGLVILLVLVIGGANQQISHGHNLTMSKIGSYQEEKLAGLWLKENTPEDSRIIISSIVQNQYYSERMSYDLYSKDNPSPQCYDLYGKLIESEECFTKTENAFREKIKKIGADYLVIHIFEPVFTPRWAYDYPQRHPGELIPIKSYNAENNQPVLIIYQFNKSSEIFN
ncbi:hypothetical protein HN743_01020 [Candidatus Woesearchaeota archaeon]|nr:hypothetical protein [Candidatus Woesearchaeota archaeon]MBT7786640.1 hypothetical protein [Candidatus Woesearchaeota archaeon]